ncbi:retrovirus-related pol polyprotein from transposon tnt 1-94, partial [Trifolium medium]|nr:retrovirus-related pol polyprotein from transposon tnt 1-94 [Trifolium medium]
MSHPKLQHLTTSKVLELFHMDLMGPMQVESLGDTFDVFKDLCHRLQRKKESVIVRIRSDDGKEFKNAKFSEFCSSEGISHEFSSPNTPQQNGVVERKNRTVQESARVMLHAKHLPYHFWAEAMNTAYYIHNRVTLRSGTSSTLYELWKGKKPTVKYFHVFGSKCYILADREQRRKMDPKSDEGIFLGYSTNSRAYRVFNSRTKTDVSDNAADIESNIDLANTKAADPQVNKGPSTRVQKNHPQELIIGDLNQGVTTRSRDVVSNSCFVSKFEPKNVKESLTDEFWINAMQEEL